MDKQMFNNVLVDQPQFAEGSTDPANPNTLGRAKDAIVQSEFKRPYARDSKGYQRMEHAVWNPAFNLYPNHGGRGYKSYPSLLGYGEENEPNPLDDLGVGDFRFQWKDGPYVCRGEYGGLYTNTLFVTGAGNPRITSVKTIGSQIHDVEIIQGKGTDVAKIQTEIRQGQLTPGDTDDVRFSVNITFNSGQILTLKVKPDISPFW
jgi:hypothetical protein